MDNISSAASGCNPSGDDWSPGILAGELSPEQQQAISEWFARSLKPVLDDKEADRQHPGSQPPGHFAESVSLMGSPFEAVTLQIGSQDVVVKHHIANLNERHKGGGKRGKITKLSKPSIKRMKLAIRNLPEGAIKCILTLTYPAEFSLDGEKAKRDLRAFRKWLGRRGIAGAWVLEFQKRGAPHFHAFLSGWPPGGVDAVARAWFKIVGSGDPKHLAWHKGELSGRPCLELMRNPHAASFYATKYAAKQEQKDVPENFTNVGRFWGLFGKLRPVWRFIGGRGSHCAHATRMLVNLFRCTFDERALQGHWMHKTFVSSVLWGGTGELVPLMSFVKWTPF